MPNRLIKDSIRFSEKVNSLSDFQFRLWVSLITYVDDYGRGDARPAVIKGTCFPLRDRITNKDIDAALNALAGAGCVGLYKVDGKPYLYFPNWQSHQNIRNKKSRFPAPENATCNQLQTIASNCEQMHANVPVIQSESESESESNPKARVSALDAALNDFAEMRKKMRKPLTDRALSLTLSELEKLAPGDDEKKIAILNQSIQRGWQGVFPLKDEPEAPKKTASVRMPHGDDLDKLERLLANLEKKPNEKEQQRS